MSMSKKDYEAIARAIQAANPPQGMPGHGMYAGSAFNACRIIANECARDMAAQSASFDRARFLKACGVSE